MEAIIFDAVIVLTLCCPRFNHTLQLQNYKTRQYPEVCGILLCHWIDYVATAKRNKIPGIR